MLEVNNVGSVIFTVVVAVQPLASVTVTDHVPAVKPVTIAVVCAGAGLFHKYVYGDVPPLAVTVAFQLFPPLQLMFVCEVIVAVTIVGSVITTDEVDVQPLASVTVTFHVPAVKPVAVAVVCAGAGSFHKYV